MCAINETRLVAQVLSDRDRRGGPLPARWPDEWNGHGCGHAVLTGWGRAVVRLTDLTPLTYGKADFAKPFLYRSCAGR